MSGVHISIAGLEAIARGMQAAPEMARRELLAAAAEAVTLLEREAKERAPQGASGALRDQLFSDAFSTPAGVLGVVSSPQPYAAVVELGRDPGGWVSKKGRKAIADWAVRKLKLDKDEAAQMAQAVAWKIHHHGQDPVHFFRNALEDNQGQITRLFEDAAARIAAHLAQPAPTAGGSA